jgi:hypothetical protein
MLGAAGNDPKQTSRLADFSTTASWVGRRLEGAGRLLDLWHPEGLYRVEIVPRRREADIFQAAVAQVLKFGTDITAPPTAEARNHQFWKPQKVGS